jgi:hypothetical protein
MEPEVCVRNYEGSAIAEFWGAHASSACWRSHSAIANFAAVQQLVPSFDSIKFVAAECGNQHATSVRYP